VKYAVFVVGTLLILYNLHSGLTARRVGLFGLDVEFEKVGDQVQVRPVVVAPVPLGPTSSGGPTPVPTAGGQPTNPPATPKPTVPSPTAAPADRCISGFVWREALPGDHVCVTPPVRDQAQSDNKQAAARRSPTGGPSGPDTCVQGFVWREASPQDHVCVTVQVRDQTAADNKQASSRIQH
jgi:hypothetical protein